MVGSSEKSLVVVLVVSAGLLLVIDYVNILLVR